jgi:hypothetical protein
MRTFTCDFGGGVSCTMSVSDEFPAAGKAHIQQCDWTGTRTRKTIRPYIAWANSVNTLLAKQWGKRLLQVFMVSDTDAEFWVYDPGKPPKKIDPPKSVTSDAETLIKHSTPLRSQ